MLLGGFGLDQARVLSLTFGGQRTPKFGIQRHWALGQSLQAEWAAAGTITALGRALRWSEPWRGRVGDGRNGEHDVDLPGWPEPWEDPSTQASWATSSPLPSVPFCPLRCVLPHTWLWCSGCPPSSQQPQAQVVTTYMAEVRTQKGSCPVRTAYTVDVHGVRSLGSAELALKGGEPRTPRWRGQWSRGHLSVCLP